MSTQNWLSFTIQEHAQVSAMSLFQPIPWFV